MPSMGGCTLNNNVPGHLWEKDSPASLINGYLPRLHETLDATIKLKYDFSFKNNSIVDRFRLVHWCYWSWSQPYNCTYLSQREGRGGLIRALHKAIRRIKWGAVLKVLTVPLLLIWNVLFPVGSLLVSEEQSTGTSFVNQRVWNLWMTPGQHYVISVISMPSTCLHYLLLF